MSSLPRSVTIRDVARLAGVSLSTVSQVLNGRTGYASPETRKRVLAAARDLRYRPNAIARGLVTARTGTLGIVIPDIVRPLFPKVVAGVEQVTRQAGYSLLLTCADDAERECEALDVLGDRRVDGIIFMSHTDKMSSDHIRRAADAGTPLVVINRPIKDLTLHQVSWDNVEVGRVATQHLISLGHRRIAHLAGALRPPQWLSALDRLTGYREAMAAAALPVDDALVIDASYRHERAFKATNALMEHPTPPTAIFAASDSMAIAAMNALHHRQLRVPDDVSVIGAGDEINATLTEPPLTTVRLPVVEAGRLAADTILAVLGALRSGPPLHQILPSELVVRASTSSPR